MRSLGNTRRTMGGARRQNSSRLSTAQFTDWIQEQARGYGEKELADITGLSLKAVQNLRLGRSACSGTTLANWCLGDPTFLARYHHFCGGYSETDPEFQQGLALLANSIARRFNKGDGA